MTWSELVAALQPVDTDGITQLALDHLQPERSLVARRDEEIWHLVGGAQGLTRMKENADIFLALAGHAQRWNREEGLAITARMKQDGLALRRAVLGLGLGKTTGYGRERMVLHAQEAASSYYLMRKRLLTLYQASQAPFKSTLGDWI